MGEPPAEKKAFDDVASRVAIAELEHDILRYWEDSRIFERSLEATRDRELFTFYDGPPYATGKPHYGHILQSAIKDVVLRYKTMRGYYVPRRVGWDTHGLPVETLVERELGFSTKKDIEEYGIEEFNQKCRETVFRYIDEFTATLKRVGRWADYDNAYATLDRNYMETEWWVFKQLWDKDLVYKDYRSTPYCIRCETPLSNFEVSTNYKDTVDTTAYVLLRLTRSGASQEVPDQLSLLIWTTTPWTLPGNAAVAISPNLKYVSVNYEGAEIIVAKDRVKAVFGEEAVAVREWSAGELVGLTYAPLYDVFGDERTEKFYSVVSSDHVTAEDGTGLVHIAPAFGQEDFALGVREGITPIQIVDKSGRYHLPDFSMAGLSFHGRNIFESQEAITADLKKRGLLYKQEPVTHSYPFCWRCDTPLIYYALDTWFVNVTHIKDQLKHTAEQINWTPSHVKEGRFGKGLESAPDWAVSRSRYWSVPMPVWHCDSCDEMVCVGSVEELKKLAAFTALPDLHRPYVDDIVWGCSHCSGRMRRVPDVLDVWFDAGSMPYAQWHYPFENKSFVEDNFPADFIVEAIEQTRLWFYVLHVLATALTDGGSDLGEASPAFTHAIGAGLILAEDGRKLSKKLKNYPEPEPTLEIYGADVMRLYLLSGATLGEPFRFFEKDLKQTQRSTYLTLWNVYSFFVRYANTHSWHPEQVLSSDALLDRWILVRLTEVERDVLKAADEYQIDRATRALIPFIDDLSNWYVRRSRQRFQRPASDAERDGAFSTLYTALTRLACLLAPFMPFVSEVMYRNLTKKESVHFEQLEDVSLTAQGQTLLDAMRQSRLIVTEGLALRAKAQIKVRQPLDALVIASEQLDGELVALIRDEVNVKEVMFTDTLPTDNGYERTGVDDRLPMALKTTLSRELKREGLAREIIRHGQVLRREAGYALDGRISLIMAMDSEVVRAVLDQHREMIMEALQADQVLESGEADAEAVITLDSEQLTLGVGPS